MTNNIIYIMGVSGCGKTTIGKLLSQRIGIPFFDGDDFHSAANVEKMKAGEPLNDEDRSEWLQKINELAFEEQQLNGAIIACSALKEKYRIVLNSGITKPVWIFLQGSYQIIFQRLQNRQGHYMPPALLQSQFDNLEIPASAFSINIANEPATIVELILDKLNEE
jgi:carbohydrate kinase (thermoresistant glucokinase family)